MKIITFLSILVLQTCISKPRPTDNIEKNWSPQKITQNNYEKAYFASGCFWCVEAIYESVRGELRFIQDMLVVLQKIQIIIKLELEELDTQRQ